MKYELTSNEIVLIKYAMFRGLSDISNSDEKAAELMSDDTMLPLASDFIGNRIVEDTLAMYEEDIALLVKDSIELIKKLK